jgi:DNA-binding XRE family transcriptional regulator
MQVNEIRGLIVARGYTKAQFAKELGMSSKTLYTKLKKGVFGSDEMEKMIEILKIEDPNKIFFNIKVT